MSPAATFPQLWRELRELEDEISALCDLSPKYHALLHRLRERVQTLRQARVQAPKTKRAAAGGPDCLPAGTLLAKVLPLVDAHLLRTHRLAR